MHKRLPGTGLGMTSHQAGNGRLDVARDLLWEAQSASVHPDQGGRRERLLAGYGHFVDCLLFGKE